MGNLGGPKAKGQENCQNYSGKISGHEFRNLKLWKWAHQCYIFLREVCFW